MATSRGGIALPIVLAFCIAGDAAAAPDPRDAPATSWDVSLGGPGARGEPLEMTGIVREPDGTVVRGRKVFIDHADDKGQYVEHPGGPLRFAGTLRTDDQGRYRIRTIFPGGYAGAPAHVHYEILEPVRIPGFVPVRRVGRGDFVAKRGRDGVWRLTVDLKTVVMGGAGNNSTGVGDYRSMRELAPDAWYPPRRDTTRSRQP